MYGEKDRNITSFFVCFRVFQVCPASFAERNVISIMCLLGFFADNRIGLQANSSPLVLYSIALASVFLLLFICLHFAFVAVAAVVAIER